VDKELGAGDKGMLKQPQSQVWSSWLLSQFLIWRGFRIVLWQMVHPEEGLLLGVVSVLCHEDVIIIPVLP
jgi:hypothetical protein